MKIAAAVVCFGLALSAPASAQIVIDSLDGEVTAHEVDTFLSYTSGLTIPTAEWTATVTHNQIADGKGGMTLAGINTLVLIGSSLTVAFLARLPVPARPCALHGAALSRLAPLPAPPPSSSGSRR